MSRRLPELDGLRGFAVLMVLSEHYIAESEHGARGTLSFVLSRIFSLGWTGVDLFFVLSGFLIGGILLDVRKSPNYVKTFYLRRIHRILPLYYLWLALYLIVGYVGARWVTPHAPGVFAISVPIAVYILFCQNFVFGSISLFGTYFVGPTWSLAVEEQFYLISPWLVRYLSPHRLAQTLILCIIFAPLLRALLLGLPHGHRAVYFLMPCRADCLAMGMLAALAWRTRTRAWLVRNRRHLKVALVFLLLGALAILRWQSNPTRVQEVFQYSWMACLYTCLMMVTLLAPESLVARLSRLPLLRGWGRISYCVYLIHLAILALCHLVLLRSLPRISDLPGVFATILAVGLTWLVARLSWRYFEKPLVDRGHDFKYKPLEVRPVQGIPAAFQTTLGRESESG
jgi:peptidoglycan/LPS O-acetylase OafA/YrhL